MIKPHNIGSFRGLIKYYESIKLAELKEYGQEMKFTNHTPSFGGEDCELCKNVPSIGGMPDCARCAYAYPCESDPWDMWRTIPCTTGELGDTYEVLTEYGTPTKIYRALRARIKVMKALLARIEASEAKGEFRG